MSNRITDCQPATAEECTHVILNTYWKWLVEEAYQDNWGEWVGYHSCIYLDYQQKQDRHVVLAERKVYDLAVAILAVTDPTTQQEQLTQEMVAAWTGKPEYIHPGFISCQLVQQDPATLATLYTAFL